LAEAVATFGLVLTIFGGVARSPTAVPYAVGLYITSAYWFTASTSFANPAVMTAAPETFPAFTRHSFASALPRERRVCFAEAPMFQAFPTIATA
jgi:glycerol uptake facilitator-like aquaporin